MRNWPNLRAEKYRAWHPRMGSGGQGYGYFEIPTRSCGSLRKMRVIFSGGEGADGWEHASVSLENRPPTWAEMQIVKEIFWRDDETAIQYHPAKIDFIEIHPHTLHLWKPIDIILPMPPKWMV